MQKDIKPLHKDLAKDSTVQNDVKLLHNPGISSFRVDYAGTCNKQLDYAYERQRGLYSKYYHNGKHMGRNKSRKVERGRRNSLRLHRWDLFWNPERDSG